MFAMLNLFICDKLHPMSLILCDKDKHVPISNLCLFEEKIYIKKYLKLVFFFIFWGLIKENVIEEGIK